MKRWKSVTLLKSERGFTLIEMLFSLTITLIVAQLILQALLVIQPIKENKKEINPLEWELFLHHLKREVKKAEGSTIIDNSLFFDINGEQYSVEMYKDMLRQRVNGVGHVVLLHNVKSYHVEKNGSFIEIVIHDLSDKQHSAKLLYYHE